MRRLIKFLSILLVTQLAFTPLAIAAGAERDAPLQVSQAIAAGASPAFRPVSHGTIGIHDVSLNGKTVPLRVRYGDVDLIDARAAEALLGNDIRRHGDTLRFDRPDTAKRVEVTLTTGLVRVDGTPTASVATETIAGQDRLWLGEAVLEALSGGDIAVAGRASRAKRPNHEAAVISTPDTHAALLSPRVRSSSSPTRLVLTSYSAINESELPTQATEQLPPLASFEGVFGNHSSVEGPTMGRSDWRAQQGWDIEPTRPVQEVEPQIGLQFASVAEADTAPSQENGITKRKQTQPDSTSAPAGPPQVLLASAAIEGPLLDLKTRPATTSTQQSDKAPKAQVRIERSHTVNQQPETAGSISGTPQPKVAHSTSRTSELRGVIVLDRDEDGASGLADQRLEGERVQLIDADTGHVHECRSASFGRFSFSGIAPGVYRLRVMTGWQEHVREIHIAPGQTVIQDAVLSAHDEPRGPPEFPV